VPIVAALIVVLVGVAAVLYTRYVEPQAVAVPSLAGKPLLQAQSVLAREHLRARVAGFRDDSHLPYGDVIATAPAAGRSILPKGRVSLVLSAGPPTVPGGVPNVQGQGTVAAEQVLQGVGLSVVQILRRPSNVYGRGSVIDTLPPAGTGAWVGQDVSLVVSTGQTARTVAMPALVGKALAAWQAALAADGLSVSAIRYGSSSAPAGQVLSQSPAAGTPVSAGSTLSVVLSAGSGGAVLTAPDAVQQQSASIDLPTSGFQSGTPVMVQVVSEEGSEPVLVVPHATPGQRLAVTYTWRGDGTLRVWFAGRVVKSMSLPVSSTSPGA
jgi:serine/threonine-protein kinase